MASRKTLYLSRSAAYKKKMARLKLQQGLRERYLSQGGSSLSVSPIDTETILSNGFFRVVRTVSPKKGLFSMRDRNTDLAMEHAQKMLKDIVSTYPLVKATRYTIFSPSPKYKNVPLVRSRAIVRSIDVQTVRSVKTSIHGSDDVVNLSTPDGTSAVVELTQQSGLPATESKPQKVKRLVIEAENVTVTYDNGILSVYVNQQLVSKNLISPSSRQHEKIDEQDASEKASIRRDILRYVKHLLDLLVEEHRSNFMELWEKILATPEVAAEIYNPGKQQLTTFNRNLVANIIYVMGHYGDDRKMSLFKKYNATTIADALEGDKDHSVRAALGTAPSPSIYKKVTELLQSA